MPSLLGVEVEIPLQLPLPPEIGRKSTPPVSENSSAGTRFPDFFYFLNIFIQRGPGFEVNHHDFTCDTLFKIQQIEAVFAIAYF